MNTEALIWILFILFLVSSNITSYKMGYVRGMMHGITTYELLQVRKKLARALDVEIMTENGQHEVLGNKAIIVIAEKDPLIYDAMTLAPVSCFWCKGRPYEDETTVSFTHDEDCFWREVLAAYNKIYPWGK